VNEAPAFPAASGPSSDDRFAADLRGFGPLGILAILVILAGNFVIAPLSALLVLLWVRQSRTPWRDVGYVRPRSWLREILVGVAFGIALKLVMKAVVMPLLGADPINHAYQHLVGNRTASLMLAFQAILVAGFGEETLFRGYMFERLGKLLGKSAGARALTVLATATLFGLAHYPGQGVPGVQQALVVGLVFGTIFAVRGRIWMLMSAHAAFDLAAIVIIYGGLETAVARFFFR
jgi:membrane protease YdiL (CAAX protease family)